MSRIGVPSSMSTPRTCSSTPSRRRSSTTVSPIGFGRRGERVANTPCGRVSNGGEANSSKSRERSNSQRTMRCEKPSMSVSPASNSGKILSTPSASCLAPGPLGTSFVFWYGLLTNPIGREVNILQNASLGYGLDGYDTHADGRRLTDAQINLGGGHDLQAYDSAWSDLLSSLNQIGRAHV